MTDNELLFAISDMLDKKLKSVNDRLNRIELTQENDILPRLQNIVKCYHVYDFAEVEEVK